MERTAPRAVATLGALLFALSLFAAPCAAQDELDFGGALARTKVGQSGLVYRWKPDC